MYTARTDIPFWQPDTPDGVSWLDANERVLEELLEGARARLADTVSTYNGIRDRVFRYIAWLIPVITTLLVFLWSADLGSGVESNLSALILIPAIGISVYCLLRLTDMLGSTSFEVNGLLPQTQWDPMTLYGIYDGWKPGEDLMTKQQQYIAYLSFQISYVQHGITCNETTLYDLFGRLDKVLETIKLAFIVLTVLSLLAVALKAGLA
ncbi:MAG: hypothetical protein AAF741_18785 [Bacteroidota bacterium]